MFEHFGTILLPFTTYKGDPVMNHLDLPRILISNFFLKRTSWAKATHRNSTYHSSKVWPLHHHCRFVPPHLSCPVEHKGTNFQCISSRWGEENSFKKRFLYRYVTKFLVPLCREFALIKFQNSTKNLVIFSSYYQSLVCYGKSQGKWPAISRYLITHLTGPELGILAKQPPVAMEESALVHQWLSF